MILTTWPQIKRYLRLSRYKILLLGYPVYTLPEAATVYADTDALDQHADWLMEHRLPVSMKKDRPKAERS